MGNVVSFPISMQNLPSSLSKNQYIKMVSISFYEAVETDIDVQSLREKQVTSILDK